MLAVALRLVHACAGRRPAACTTRGVGVAGAAGGACKGRGGPEQSDSIRGAYEQVDARHGAPLTCSLSPEVLPPEMQKGGKFDSC